MNVFTKCYNTKEERIEMLVDLNSLASYCHKIAHRRAMNESDCSIDSLELLKHCAGEVIEATEAFANKDKKPAEFAGELCDVITCCMILLDKHCFDVTNCLYNTISKNAKRAGYDGMKGISDRI